MIRDTVIVSATSLGAIEVTSFISSDTLQAITQISIAVVAIVKLIIDINKKNKVK